MKPRIHSVDELETAVLARIARHRQDQLDPGTLPTGLTLAVIALTVGMVIGWSQARQLTSPHRSENVLLADDARLAPSSLLVSNQ